ncbi:MAG: AAA family ATPase [Bacillota bacterium]
MSIFDQRREKLQREGAPLADRMRPRTLDELVGQDHIVGEGRLLRRALEADRMSSMILYGPPGSGKTTIAEIIAQTTSAHFEKLNAVMSGVADLRRVISEAEKELGLSGRRTILFVDEVHRFNKAQQDALLPAVEKGTVIFIGATTENPYFEVTAPLVSRSRVFELHALDEDDVKEIVRRALEDEERGLAKYKPRVEPEALDHVVRIAGGDARSALNAVELAVLTTKPDPEDGTRRVTLEIAEESIQRRALVYDADGDAHYDTISAFIKSMRGSDPDATLYWLARMIYAGEDPSFISRRLVIHAAEDVGLADPQALVVAEAAAAAVDRVGLPEGRIILAEAALYIALAPKSNSALGIDAALRDVERGRAAGVPTHLRDASYRGARKLGRGEGYEYPHDYPDGWVEQRYLPEGFERGAYYHPPGRGREARLLARLRNVREEAGDDEQ